MLINTNSLLFNHVNTAMLFFLIFIPFLFFSISLPYFYEHIIFVHTHTRHFSVCHLLVMSVILHIFEPTSSRIGFILTRRCFYFSHLSEEEEEGENTSYTPADFNLITNVQHFKHTINDNLVNSPLSGFFSFSSVSLFNPTLFASIFLDKTCTAYFGQIHFHRCSIFEEA